MISASRGEWPPYSVSVFSFDGFLWDATVYCAHYRKGFSFDRAWFTQIRLCARNYHCTPYVMVQTLRRTNNFRCFSRVGVDTEQNQRSAKRIQTRESTPPGSYTALVQPNLVPPFKYWSIGDQQWLSGRLLFPSKRELIFGTKQSHWRVLGIARVRILAEPRHRYISHPDSRNCTFSTVCEHSIAADIIPHPMQCGNLGVINSCGAIHSR